MRDAPDEFLVSATSEIRRDGQKFSSGKCAGVRINGRKAFVFQVVYMPTLSIRAENVEIRTGRENLNILLIFD